MNKITINGKVIGDLSHFSERYESPTIPFFVLKINGDELLNVIMTDDALEKYHLAKAKSDFEDGVKNGNHITITGHYEIKPDYTKRRKYWNDSKTKTLIADLVKF